MRVPIQLLIIVVLSAVTLGCDTMQYEDQQAQSQLQGSGSTVSSEPLVPESRTVTATGYAPISLQSGQNKTQKMLNAMRASKLQAYRELTAIVHGQYLFGTTQVQDMVLQNDAFNAAVGGVIRGARVVKTFPLQNDTYATILELDIQDVQRAYINTQY